MPRRPSTGGLLTPGGSRPEKPRGPQMRRPQSRHAWNLRFAPRPITPPRNVAHSWSGSSTMAPASVIIIGDSNVSYSSTRRQPWRWVSQHSCGTFQFPPMVEILQRLAPCPVAYVPLPQLRVLHNISLTLQMTAHTLPKPCTAIILAGQNDADEWSRYSTRCPEELKGNFCATMRQRVRWLQGLLQQLGLQQIWVLPFDDPSGQFTPLYQDLVKGYVEVLKAASGLGPPNRGHSTAL